MPINYITKFIMSHERNWCKYLNIYNPYSDPWPIRISKNMPDFDHQAYEKYRHHNYLYDKLYVTQSQGIKGDTLEKLIQSPNKYLEFPIFIKPRYGNKTSSSKNCYKINSYDELNKYKNIPNMMWSEFIDDTEKMTDFFIYNGKIIYQLTYIYSETQHGTIADDWKKISPCNMPPQSIINWVERHMNGFSGACNVQYRGDKIIEVALRLARGGAYIYSTNNQKLITSINNLFNNNEWDLTLKNDDFYFKEYYSFKCYTDIPIIYLFPQHVMDILTKRAGCKDFYEYYFEPAGKGLSMVCYQFLHEDFEKGMKFKKFIETLINVAQIVFILAYILAILIFLFYSKKIGLIFIIIISILFTTKLINPLTTQINLWNAQKQAFLN